VLLLALSWAGVRNAQAGSKVDEIRHWSNPNYTRIVINLDKRASYTHRLLKKDPSINKPWRRLYIDIDNARIAPGLQKSIPIHDGFLKQARVGQYDKKTVRVVLDIETIKDYKIFPLSNPFRIVIDVTGEAGDKGKASQPVLSTPPTLIQQMGLKVRRIVIDAGHGGKDPGAIGRSGLKEKDVTLRLARKLKTRLKKDLDAEVILTRDRDVYIPLEERTAIANSKDADLFVSIHINAAPRRKASGIETYILNISNDEEAKRGAARENATSNRSVSDLEFILNDLIKTAKTNDSARLAESVQTKLLSNLRLTYRNVKGNGVKSAPFYVLVGTKMPAILVEVSFISNPLEEKRLKSDRYLNEVVEGISKGLQHYVNGPGSV
jgi:N-acetylmuramoyl-L-alanine amidase